MCPRRKAEDHLCLEQKLIQRLVERLSTLETLVGELDNLGLVSLYKELKIRYYLEEVHCVCQQS